MAPSPAHIYDLLSRQAKHDPAAIALTAPSRQPLSYGRLQTHVEDIASTLHALGIRRGDRVAIVLSNGPELATAFLAVACCASCAPLNPAYRAPEFDFYLSDLNAKALIIEAGTDSPAVTVAQKRDIPVVHLHPQPEAEAGLFMLTGDRSEVPRNGRAAAPGDEALVLHTSGTTSRPKMVPLTHRNLCVSAHNVRNTLRLEARDRCMNVMPLFHIHGLVGALLSSMAAGASVICTPGFYAPQFFEWMDACHPTWYTAVPTMHQAILDRAEAHRDVIERRPLRLIRSSSSSLPPRVMEQLERAFEVPVVEAYGMTEAAHQMACNPLPPGKRKPGSVGPAAGPEVAIMDETGVLLETGQNGEIVIRGANVTSGYAGNPEANTEAFTNGWFRTGDEGYLDADDYLYITGRIKELINRGGEKIAPREIDEVLLDHPAVRQAVAFAMPNERLGEEAAAAVVLQKDPSVTPQELRRFAAEQLAPFKVPREIVIVDEIPKGPTGKLQRIGLAERLGLPTEEDFPHKETAHVPPRTPAEEVLATLWEEVLDVESVSVEARFLDAGGDSMLATRLAARVREALRVNLTLVDFFDAPTVAEQARLLEDKMLNGENY